VADRHRPARRPRAGDRQGVRHPARRPDRRREPARRGQPVPRDPADPPGPLTVVRECTMATTATAARTRRPADPEIDLMLRVQRHEPGAFAELVARYWPRVFGRFFRQLGDRQEAEDLAQNVFLRLYRVRHRYRPAARFATWLFHIARNVARNALRT